MSHVRTVVETLKVEGGHSTDQGTGELFYLLHWGLQMNYIMETPTAETVAICQEVRTGRIRTFLPESIKVIGIEKD